jgi:predicted MFS family arabinose efflux permease
MVCAASLISRWYRARLSTAIAVAYAGSGCGVLVMVPLSQALIDTIGWRGAWLALGCGAMLLVPLCAFLPWARLSRPPQPGEAGTGEAGTGPAVTGPAGTPAAQPAPRRDAARHALRAALVDPAYWRLSQVFFFTALASYLVTPQVVALLIEGGFAPLFAASAYGLAGLLSTFGIIGSGWFSDRIGHRRTALLSFTSTALGLGGLILVATTGSLAGLAVYVVCFGLAQGARGPIVSALSNRIFAGPGVATIYGTIFGLMAFGAGLGAWAGGLLHDLTGAYWPVALVSGVALALAAAPFRVGGVLMARVQALGRPR